MNYKKMYHLIKLTKCLPSKHITTVNINNLDSTMLPCVFRKNCFTTWSMLCSYKRSAVSSDARNPIPTSSDKELNSASSNFLYQSGLKEEKKSKAMQAYLDRAQKYNAFMQEQRDQYNVGKRHLANIMGADPDTFTPEDVDAAIEYLFPSGLFVPAARPFMKPPEIVFPAKKDAEFDDSGRPFHFLFYTGRPNFFQLLHDFYQHLSNLNDYEDRMIRKQLKPDPNVKIELGGSVWISKEDLEKRLVETITDKEYNNFINLLERIIAHPYVYNIKDTIMDVRTTLMDLKMDFTKPPKPSYDENGRAYVTTSACPRKSARADVTVWYPGTGKININGEDITYFKDVQPREQILYPLHFSEMLGKVDVDATVTGGGTSGQAGAVRWGIAWGLRSFISPEIIDRMRLAGLLTRDVRTRERKKPGQWKARRKYTWKKR